MYTDLQIIGDKVWERFNANKEKKQWYYDLKEMVNDIFTLDWSNYKDK